MITRILNPLAKSCSIQHRRPQMDSLEERIVKARSSMSLRTCLMSYFDMILKYTEWKILT